MAFLCLSEFTMIKILSCAYKHCHLKLFTIWVKYITLIEEGLADHDNIAVSEIFCFIWIQVIRMN